MFELQQCLHLLKNLSMKYRLPVLLTTASFSSQSLKPLGGTYLMHSAQIVIKLEETGAGVYGSLIKHPSLPAHRVLLQQPMTTGGESYLPLQTYLTKNDEVKRKIVKKTRFPQKKRKRKANLANLSVYKQRDLSNYLV